MNPKQKLNGKKITLSAMLLGAVGTLATSGVVPEDVVSGDTLGATFYPIVAFILYAIGDRARKFLEVLKSLVSILEKFQAQQAAQADAAKKTE